MLDICDLRQRARPDNRRGALVHDIGSTSNVDSIVATNVRRIPFAVNMANTHAALPKQNGSSLASSFEAIPVHAIVAALGSRSPSFVSSERDQVRPTPHRDRLCLRVSGLSAFHSIIPPEVRAFAGHWGRHDQVVHRPLSLPSSIPETLLKPRYTPSRSGDCSQTSRERVSTHGTILMKTEIEAPWNRPSCNGSPIFRLRNGTATGRLNESCSEPTEGLAQGFQSWPRLQRFVSVGNRRRRGNHVSIHVTERGFAFRRPSAFASPHRSESPRQQLGLGQKYSDSADLWPCGRLPEAAASFHPRRRSRALRQ
jgi:hypothetical protein